MVPHKTQAKKVRWTSRYGFLRLSFAYAILRASSNMMTFNVQNTGSLLFIDRHVYNKEFFQSIHFSELF